MTGRAATSLLGPDGCGLLERLTAVVRPEFRGEVLAFDAGACRIGQCRRQARGRGLCPGHLQRWVKQGRPDMEHYVATTDPRWQRQRPNQRCAIVDCGYGSARSGMCVLHGQRWDRSGRPDRQTWVAAAEPVPAPAAGLVCQIGSCELWPQASGPFCHAHNQTWRANGRPDIDAFITTFDRTAPTEDETIRLDVLEPQLQLEIAYVLQCRRDERGSKTLPTVVMQLVRFLTRMEATSLFERSEDEWRTVIGLPAGKGSNMRALLIYARRRVEDLAQADGWRGEYPRDIWQLRRLGFPGDRTLNFTTINQPWLREPAKRWIRWRLSSGIGLAAARRGLLVVARFARFCQRLGLSNLAAVDRGVLERYLADLHGEFTSSQRLGVHIGQLNLFLQAIRQHQWDESLPATAVLFADDVPDRIERLPRALPEQVMTQIEHSDNLDRWPNQAYRLITVILIRTGLRISDALGLARDCITTDGDGAPYLRYVNHKMKREALVPIDTDLHQQITAQQQHVIGKHGPGASLLLPRPTKNPDGTKPMSSATYRAALYRWLTACNIRDEHGQPVHLTPHQWRHTLGTRLINQDVPQEVVRRILDHDSPQMTAHYARLHDSTVRRHWEAARKVDITGSTVHVDPEGPLADAAWAKQRLGRATQALPNGFCGLPVQQSCPHANACLTCPMFITTAEFLPQHHSQRQETLQLIGDADTRGHTRLAEMNQRVLISLDQIIATLHDNPGEPTEDTNAR